MEKLHDILWTVIMRSKKIMVNQSTYGYQYSQNLLLWVFNTLLLDIHMQKSHVYYRLQPDFDRKRSHLLEHLARRKGNCRKLIRAQPVLTVIHYNLPKHVWASSTRLFTWLFKDLIFFAQQSFANCKQIKE